MHEITIGFLLVWLLVAVCGDVRSYRIPNSLVLSGALVGTVLNVLYPPEADTLGLLTSLAGSAIGLVVLLPLYLFRVMGAGDIKLMAMIGAFVGPGAMLGVTMYVLIAGGVLAIGLTLLRGRMTQLLDNLKLMLLLKMVKSPDWRLPIDGTTSATYNKLPYGVAIASGTIIYLLTV